MQRFILYDLIDHEATNTPQHIGVNEPSEKCSTLTSWPVTWSLLLALERPTDLHLALAMNFALMTTDKHRIVLEDNFHHSV